MFLSIGRPVELRADASREDNCPQPSTSACPTFPRTANATLTRGRVQRRVEWDALVPARPLPFLGFDSCLVLNALTGSFEQATPSSTVFAISNYARLRCPETCGSGSRCVCISCCISMALTVPVERGSRCVRTHSATSAHLRQGHARPHHHAAAGMCMRMRLDDEARLRTHPDRCTCEVSSASMQGNRRLTLCTETI